MIFGEEEPWVDPLELKLANARHDQELAASGISPYGRISSAWKAEKLTMRGKLSDRKITQYEARGFYSAEYRAARKLLMDKKALKNGLNRAVERKGNFIERDGRLIYTP